MNEVYKDTNLNKRTIVRLKIIASVLYLALKKLCIKLQPASDPENDAEVLTGDEGLENNCIFYF